MTHGYRWPLRGSTGQWLTGQWLPRQICTITVILWCSSRRWWRRCVKFVRFVIIYMTRQWRTQWIWRTSGVGIQRLRIEKEEGERKSMDEEGGGGRKEEGGWGRAEGRMWMLGLWICWSRFECWIFEFVWWDLNVRALNLLEEILMLEQWIC